MDATETLLLRCGLHPSTYDLNTLSQISLSQLRIGLYGGKSTLPLEPSLFLPNAYDTGTVAVAYCSEAMLHTAIVHCLPDSARWEAGESFPLPGADYPAPIEDLLFAVVELLQDALLQCRHLALCLPFCLHYAQGGVFLQKTDLQLTHWADVDLQLALTKELTSRGFAHCRACILPSVNAAQVGALARNGRWGRYLSLYWAESFTAGLSLPNHAILKLNSGDNRLRLLDCGMGCLEAVPLGLVDLSMDRDAPHPGEGLLNKLLSTRYLGEQFRFSMIQAAESSLLTFMCGRDFLSLRKLSTDSLLQFLQNPDGDHRLGEFCRHEATDKALAVAVGEAVLTRAFTLIAGQLLALLHLSGTGRDADHPPVLVLSGDAFGQAPLYHRFVAFLQKNLHETHGFHFTLCHDEGLIPIGGAFATLAP